MDRQVIQQFYLTYTILFLYLALSLRLAPPPGEILAPVNLQHVARHVGTRQTAEEKHQAGEVAGAADAARGLAGLEGAAELAQAVGRHARGEDAGADDVDHDVFGRELRGLQFGEVDAGCFGGAVGKGAGAGGSESAAFARGYVGGLEAWWQLARR